MTSSRSQTLTAATPRYGNHFDAWNSSASGHQTAANNLSASTSWRQSRTIKLSDQLKSGASGGKRISDMVGAGSEHWDAKGKTIIPKDVRSRPRVSVADLLVSKRPCSTSQKRVSPYEMGSNLDMLEKTTGEPLKPSKRGIFDGLTIYINGSTAPLISDHRLKYLLAENGARISIHLGRRQVTHVILGTPCASARGMGAGGGLAAGKIQKENKRRGGCGIRYVGVQWALESLEAGIRLPEARFATVAIASKGERDLYASLTKTDSRCSRSVKESDRSV